MTPHSEHIRAKYHLFKQHDHDGEIKLVKVNTKDQVTNCMTKGLEKMLLEQARLMLAGW